MNQESFFPNFKPLEIGDRETIHTLLWQYQPEISEWTFSNLYMWRKISLPKAIFESWLFLSHRWEGKPMPWNHRPPSRKKAVLQLLGWLSNSLAKPEIDRADKRIVNDCGLKKTVTEPQHFDYLYYHKSGKSLRKKVSPKRNHLNRFFRNYCFDYQPLTDSHISQCMEFSARWCRIYHCKGDPSLFWGICGCKSVPSSAACISVVPQFI